MKCETNMLQDPNEFNKFLTFISEQQVRSYLEIGSKHGGTFWRISNRLPKGSRVVSVDLPHGDGSFKDSEPNLKQCVDALEKKGYEAWLFLGDSTDQKIVDEVRKLAPFDLCFIDANHTEPYVLKDWQNYGPMARIVAFHDIGFKQLSHKRVEHIHVPALWNKLKEEYKNIEFKFCPASNGIGILWR